MDELLKKLLAGQEKEVMLMTGLTSNSMPASMISWKPSVDTLPRLAGEYEEGDAIWVEDMGGAWIVQNGELVQLTSSCHEEPDATQYIATHRKLEPVDLTRIELAMKRVKAELDAYAAELKHGDRVLVTGHQEARKNGVYTYNPTMIQEDYVYPASPVESRGSKLEYLPDGDFTMEFWVRPMTGYSLGETQFVPPEFEYPTSSKKHLSSRPASTWLAEFDEIAADVRSMARPGKKILSSRG